MEQSEQNAVAGVEAIPESATRQRRCKCQSLLVSGSRSGRPRTGATIFDLKDVSIFYGSFRAVTNVSLTIYEHEITAFIGPSGCGKTTVLRTLNRMNDLVPGAQRRG